MADFFRVKIAGKRQVTLPQLMLNQLGLREGDELEFSVADGAIRAVRPFRLVPLDYFTPDVRRILETQVEEMASGVDDGLLAEEVTAIATAHEAGAVAGHAKVATAQVTARKAQPIERTAQ